jgi:hypothetical protein
MARASVAQMPSMTAATCSRDRRTLLESGLRARTPSTDAGTISRGLQASCTLVGISGHSFRLPRGPDEARSVETAWLVFLRIYDDGEKFLA